MSTTEETAAPVGINPTRFELRGTLGEGGMGVVYEVFDREAREVVALKTLRALSAAGLERFKNEFRALADLHHPNLVQLYELYAEGQAWFFTMELLRDAESFLEHVRPGGVVFQSESTMAAETRALTASPGHDHTLAAAHTPPADADADADADASGPRVDALRAALAQLAAGVAALHAAGKVHRDLKPSNVLVTPEGRVVVLDFGLVTEPRGPEASEGMMGTPWYMAPEQVTGEVVGPAADWYAVGAMLYECLTGAAPFTGSIQGILSGKVLREPMPVALVAPAAPADLAALCDALLQRDPAKRPGDAEVLACLQVAADPARVAAGVFVGRARELAALRAAHARARRGPVSVVIDGESGIGKSALVRTFLAGLGPETTALVGRCYEREHVSYKAFDAAMDALGRVLRGRGRDELAALVTPDAALLARMFPTLGRVAALAELPADDADPRDPRDRAAAALRAILRGLAARAPVVLVADDLQWADAESFRLLESVLLAADAPPVLWIATVRGDASALEGAAPWLRDVLRVRLLPLEADDALALARALGRDRADADALALAREAGGHPLFLEELAQHAAGAPEARGASLEAALWTRVAKLAPSTRRVLEVVSVAGSPVTPSLAAEAAGLGAGGSTRSPDVAALRAAHLVRTTGPSPQDPIEPYHARVAEAVRARLDAAALRAHHRALAETVERVGVQDGAEGFLVLHLEAAGEPARAAEQALRAAERARSAFAFEHEAGFYRTALRLGRFTAARTAALQSSLGEALGRCAQGPEAAEAYLAAAARCEGAAKLEAQRHAVRQLLGAGETERGIGVVRTIARDLGLRFPESELEGTLSLLWHRALIALASRRVVERAEHEVPAAVLRRIDSLHAFGFGLSQVGLVRGEDLQARALYLALRAGERKRVARALLAESHYHATATPAGRRHAFALIERGARIADATRDPYLLAMSQAVRGPVTFLCGRFRDALPYFERGAEMLREGALDPWYLNQLWTFRFLSQMHFVGELARERPLLDGVLQHLVRRGNYLSETVLRMVAVPRWLASDEPARVRAHLDRPTWVPTGVAARTLRRYETWMQLFELWGLAQRALYVDARAELDEAARRFERAEGSFLLRAVQVMRARNRWLRGLVALARARHTTTRDAADAIALASTLADKEAREGTAYGVAIADLLRAGVLSARGDREGARAAFARGARAATQAELRLAAAAARWRLGERGDEAARVEADRALREQGVVDPARMADVLVPR